MDFVEKPHGRFLGGTVVDLKLTKKDFLFAAPVAPRNSLPEVNREQQDLSVLLEEGIRSVQPRGVGFIVNKEQQSFASILEEGKKKMKPKEKVKVNKDQQDYSVLKEAF
jgi:hypothetical protein